MSTSAPALPQLANVTSSLTQTQAFPTIPIEDDPTPPDTSALQLVTDLVDFAQPLPGLETATTVTGSQQNYGRDLSFDFDTGEPFGTHTGNFTYADSDDQVFQWIEKALETPQGQYPIYPANYGSTLHDQLGLAGPQQTVYSEIARTTRACILAHPRVVSAQIVDVYRQRFIDADGIFVVAQLQLDSGDDPTERIFQAA